MEQVRQRPRSTRNGEPSSSFYAAGLAARSAPLVRDSSRRITTMRLRPANIRVINRRESHLDCCLTCSIWKRNLGKENLCC